MNYPYLLKKNSNLKYYEFITYFYFKKIFFISVYLMETILIK